MLDHDSALEDEGKSDPSSEAMKDIHAEAMRRFEEAVRPQIEVRELALTARRFVNIPGAMWDGDFGEMFENSVKLEINKAKTGVEKIENDYRQNRVVPDFRPAGGDSDNDTANTLDGMHRADSYHYKAQQGRDNAFSEASQGGFGAYRLTNEYADPLDKDSDEQRVNPGGLIPDADQKVFFGPSTRYDKSDAKYAFVLTGIAREVFEEDYDGKATSWPDGLTRTWYDWYRTDQIVVAEYYVIEEKDESLLIFTLQATDEEQRHWEKDFTAEERKDLIDLGWKERKRRVKRRRCCKYVLSGAEVLEGPKNIAGGNIPIVPVYGKRAYIDGVEWFKGHVQDKMDPSRLYNSTVSRLAEINSMAPYERPIFLAEQMPPAIKKMWERGNIDRHPYALVNPVIDPLTGAYAAMGPIGKVEPPQVPATTAALLEIANRDLTEDDQDSSQQVKANTSEEAMQLAAQRIDAKSGIYLDNMRQSVQREGELYLAMACEIYTEEGREVETMTEDGDDGVATLHEDYKDGNVLKTRNNFAEGKYKVIASVTEATSTRRDRTVKQMLSLAEIQVAAQDAAGAQASIITASSNMDGEGLDDFQKWNRKRGLEIGLFEPSEDEKREAAEAEQQQGQQPDPATVLAQAQAQKLGTASQLDQAKAVESKASTMLKVAQAQAVGGPEKAPEAPSGLSAANDQVEQVAKLAGARLHVAQAEKIGHDIQHQRIKTGHQIEMERRQQDHAERESKTA